MILALAGVRALLDTLARDGRRVIGPTVHGEAIVYDDVASLADLPAGWTDEQDGGTYRLRRRGDGALFGHASGPHSWKRFLFPPRSLLFRARPDNVRGFEIVDESPPPPRYAFVGVRACDLHAIAIQDRVFLDGPHLDPAYLGARDGAFVVAVNCGEPGGTCFCASMGTGPRVPPGHDVALTELLDGDRHEFLAEAGTERGAELLAGIPHRSATADDTRAANAVIDRTTSHMGRALQAAGLRDLLADTLEHPRWDDIASRCLACTNCTLVCPTCFCSTVEDVTDIASGEVAREQRWASCFALEHSLLHGGSVRATVRARYRQWLTHKLGTWIDQFGTSGCVGCGRCITWCPVGIDLTEEVRALAAPVVGKAAR